MHWIPRPYLSDQPRSGNAFSHQVMLSRVYPAAAGAAALFVLVPLPALRRTSNVAVLVSTACVFLSCFIYFINTIVWAGNTRDVFPVWCDLTTNFWMYSQLSMEFAALCICKHLYWISSPESAFEKAPNRVYFELALCCLVPLITIPIRYALSTHRYIILEDWGCIPAIYSSELSWAIIFGPQVGICLQAFLYACLAVRHLVTRRTSHTAQSKTSSALTTPRFIRLLVLCPFMGIWPGLIVCFILLVTFRDGLHPWIGWHAIHQEFPAVIQRPVFEQSPSLQRITMVVYWIYISNAFAFAAILISGEDVRRTYRSAWDSFMDTFSRSTRRFPKSVRTDSPRWLYSTAHNQSTIMPSTVSSCDVSRMEC